MARARRCALAKERSLVDGEETYTIVRFFTDDTPRQIILEGCTLEEAQDHCKRDDTRGDGWFDGYEKEGT